MRKKSKNLITPFIYDITKNIFEATDLTIEELSSGLSMTKGNVYKLFKKNNIDTALLARVSVVLNHNFWGYYTQGKVDELEQNVEELEKEIYLIRLHNESLIFINNMLAHLVTKSEG